MLFWTGFHAAYGQAAPPSATSVDLSPEAVVEANTLQGDGKRPFHLKLSFQTFDLEGKAADQGTLEYWWAGPDGSRLDISSAALGTVHDTRLTDTESETAARSLYFIGELLDDIRSPGAMLGRPSAEVKTEPETVGGVRLNCMHTVAPASVSPPVPMKLCTDTTTGTIRLIATRDHEVARNRVAIFGATRVALDITVFWGGKKAITGHVDQLQSFNPSSAGVALVKPAVTPETKEANADGVRVAAGVLAGKKIGGSQPTYPFAARESRTSGTVVLAAEITKEGKIARLVPLASPDPSLTGAAIDAVRTWTYQPYLLNGEPTTVSTTITVNFNLSSNR